jgi:uncharacterized membrane protein
MSVSVSFEDAVKTIGSAIEACGIGVIAIVVVTSLAMSTRSIVRGSDRDGAFRDARRNVGQGILLGLELLVAGDIVRTVVIDPSLTSVAILAAVVAIRTFLSITIETEITGHFPWRRPTNPADRQ